METVLNQILEAQMTEHLGARPHERTAERQGYRQWGAAPGRSTPEWGRSPCTVPQTRDGSFSPELFKR
ncbi:transposase mutator type, partial [mine drainage metagenome]